MKIRLSFIIVSAMLFFTACSQEKKQVEVPKDDLSSKTVKPNGPINDFEKVFNREQRYALLQLVGDYKTATGIEIFVVTIDSTMVTRDEFNNYTFKLGNEWEIAKETGKGILIGFSRSYRMIRINNNHSIEKLISDQETKEIVDKYFIPNFKNGKYFEGTFQGITALKDLLKTKIKQ